MLESDAHWRKTSLRHVFDAIRYKCRTGCQWRALPSQFPAFEAVAYYFYRWSKQGLWQRLSQHVSGLDRSAQGRAPQPSLVCVDSQSVKLAPRAFEHRGTDRHKGINGRKHHIAVDTGGRIWAASVTAASCHDGVSGLALLAQLPASAIKTVVADGAYRGRFAAALAELDIDFQVGARPETAKGFVPIKRRWVVERTFAWMNFYKELIRDYTYTPAATVAWMLIFNICLCLNRL